jgi:carboxyl-terminal processing protease
MPPQDPRLPGAPQKNDTRVRSIVVVVLIFIAGFALGQNYTTPSFLSRMVPSSNSNLPRELDTTSVNEVYRALKKNFDGELDEQAMLDGMKQGLAQSTGDPYTEYLNETQAKEFNEDLSGSFSGIGAELGKDGNFVVIVAPISGFPAEKAGLQPRDVILEIDGESAQNLSVTEAVTKIRGPVGTSVSLKLLRGEGEQVDVEITREQITIPSVEWELLDDGIGYIKISRFGEDTTQLTRQAAGELRDQNARSIILDLRSNPGGLLDSSVQVSSLWLERGSVVLEEKRGGNTIKTFTATGNAILQGIPTVVLVNQGSASASEIVAGALRDNNAATILGENTFGKGSVQSLENIPSGGVLKVTIARWFTPKGSNIDEEGLKPDKEVERTPEDIQNNRDPQKDAAIKHLGR